MPKEITLNHITKIEGHAKLNLSMEGGKVTKCELSATEGSRYFEGIVRGRKYYEAHEMTSRICGICSCAHVIAALSAVEDALGVQISEQTYKLRELLTLGERIRSHATHLYFLALPDYLGYESALAMAPKYGKELKSALAMMKAGNGIIRLLGSRDLHPVSATVGGWLKLPKQEQIDEIRKSLEQIRTDTVETCELFSSFRYPKFETKGKFFSLINPKKYPMLEGSFGSDGGIFDKSKYSDFIKEYHEPYSSANFVVRQDKRYAVGALSRINTSGKQLSKEGQKALKKSQIRENSKNPYHNNMAQAIELVHYVGEGMKICEELAIKDEKPVKANAGPGRGVGAIEVPRGTLWHEYSINSEGKITNANIITPTAQNLLNMQEDIREFVPSVAGRKKEEIIIQVEKLIRSYDPCFSCSAHFLEVKWA